MTPPNLTLLCEAKVHVAPAIEMGPGPNGAHRVIPITGGGAEIEARYVIETAAGARISVVNRGLRHGPPAVM